MYTTDEWGNSVFHIMTGQKGMELLKERGFTNTMSREEYKKHMESHYKLQEQRSEILLSSLKDLLNKK